MKTKIQKSVQFIIEAMLLDDGKKCLVVRNGNGFPLATTSEPEDVVSIIDDALAVSVDK